MFQYLKVHLEFLQFLLKEGDIYLAWPRCKDIWDTLVANPKASGYDKEVRGVSDVTLVIDCEAVYKRTLQIISSK